jgi:hypothetical protein
MPKLNGAYSSRMHYTYFEIFSHKICARHLPAFASQVLAPGVGRVSGHSFGQCTLSAMIPSMIRIAAKTHAINLKSRRAKTMLWRMRSSSNTNCLPTVSLSDSRSVQ